MTGVAQEAKNEEGVARGWFIALGIVLMLIGIGALAFPFVATLSVEFLVGASLFISGVVMFFHSFTSKGWGGFFLELLLSILYIVAGVFFIANPLSGMFAITAMLAVFFIADGMMRVVMGFSIRPDKAWGWFLASGLLTLLLGVLVATGIASGTSLAFIGLLVGINLIFAGVAFIAFGNQGSVVITRTTMKPKAG